MLNTKTIPLELSCPRSLPTVAHEVKFCSAVKDSLKTFAVTLSMMSMQQIDG